MSFFSVSNLSAGYGPSKVVRELSFCAQRSELVGILGANGCGKTTLLKAVCGILPHTGTCSLHGTRLDGLSARQIARLVKKPFFTSSFFTCGIKCMAATSLSFHKL